MRTTRVIAALQVLAALTVTSVVAGDPNESAAESKSLLSAEEASFSGVELEDLKVWAMQTGVRFEEAVEQFAGQMAFTEVANKVEASMPDAFVEAEWVAEKEPYGVLRTVGEPSAEIVDLIAQTKEDIRLEGGYTFSAREFNKHLEATYFEASALVGASNVTATGSPSSATISLLVDEDSRAEVDLLLDNLSARVPASIQFTFALHQFPNDGGTEGILGGRKWGECTAGFTVRRGTVYGLTTANHCSSVGASTAYQGTAMSLPTAPVALAVSSGDIKWRRTVSTTADPRFQAVTGGYRLVTATLNPVVGAAICKYGDTTGQKCSTVAATSLCANGYCGLSRASADISEGGDSGGPWFFGNTAMGIHHGTAPTGPFTIASAFTRIGGVNSLNLVVLTG